MLEELAFKQSSYILGTDLGIDCLLDLAFMEGGAVFLSEVIARLPPNRQNAANSAW